MDAVPKPAPAVDDGTPTTTTGELAPPHASVTPAAGRATLAKGRAPLAVLRHAMNAARDVVRSERHRGADRQTLLTARRSHLSTMLAYQQALTAARLPIPPSLRDEARLATRILRQGGSP